VLTAAIAVVYSLLVWGGGAVVLHLLGVEEVLRLWQGLGFPVLLVALAYPAYRLAYRVHAA